MSLRQKKKQNWTKYKNFFAERIPAQARNWLLEPGSLTHRIKRLCGNRRFEVKVLGQSYRCATLSEAKVLRVPAGIRVLVREVQLCCNDESWLYACTLVPVTTFIGRLQRLKRHGNRSLGAALFADRTMRRGPLYITKKQSGNQIMWGRRSVFYLQNRPLLVAEYFLPELYRAEEQTWGVSTGGLNDMKAR